MDNNAAAAPSLLDAREPGIVREWADVMAAYAPSKNRSRPVLTTYERAKIIGVRAEQLARGATAFVDLLAVADDKKDIASSVPTFDPVATAERELAARKLPFVVVRRMPDGGRELWRLRDLVAV